MYNEIRDEILMTKMQCGFIAHYAGAIMHMVDVDLLSREICQNRVLGAESTINIASNVICGKAQDENNMCQADIGAPLACYDGNGAYHIAGIYSQDTGCLPTNQVRIIFALIVMNNTFAQNLKTLTSFS